MAGPILTVVPGMGDNVLIFAFVVIVIGGLGSVEGAFIAAIMVGVIDTLGRSFSSRCLPSFLDRNAADNAAPAVASMLIYILMATVLFLRPQGLFPTQKPLIMDNPAVRSCSLVLLGVLALPPLLFAAIGEPFYLGVVTRMMISALRR